MSRKITAFPILILLALVLSISACKTSQKKKKKKINPRKEMPCPIKDC